MRLAPNARRARELADRLAEFEPVPMPGPSWAVVLELQQELVARSARRAVPPADLLIAAALQADVELLHYDADYEAIAHASDLRHRWLVARGTL